MDTYSAVRQNIIKYIKENKLKIGDKLPNENEFSEYLGISRMTLRETMNALRQEGLIHSVQGKGTYVSCSLEQIYNTLNINSSITEMIAMSGYKPGVKHFEKELFKANDVIAERLEIKVNSDVVVCRRVRTADDKPVVYSIDYFAPMLTPAFLSVTDADISLYEFMEKNCQIKLGIGYAEIIPVVCNNELEEIFEKDIKMGEPLLQVRQITRDIKGIPLIYTEEYLRSDQFKFYINRRRI